jgi:hypothetical protein
MREDTGKAVVKTFAVISWIEAAMLILAGGAFLFLGPLVGEFIDQSNPVAANILSGVGITAAIIMFLAGILYLINGFGLWRFQNWGRSLTLVLAVLSLFAFPIGTIIGIVAIWLFGFNEIIKDLFQRPARAR